MYRYFKRLCDIFVSFTGLVVLSWVFLIVAILVRIFLGSPVIFKQPRPGKNGKIFMLYKFRSMSDKKDEKGNLLPDKYRLTKFGKFLRATSLDEIPQLVNILKGDMSLIGPRPRMVDECLLLKENEQHRFKVRPGITGWAQINGRNNITFDKVIQYDKEYVEKMSLWFDIKIFFKTFGYVLKKKDVNKNGTVSNESYGNYLLRTKKISEEEFNENCVVARNVSNYLTSKSNLKKNRKLYKAYSRKVEEEFDLEHKIID